MRAKTMLILTMAVIVMGLAACTYPYAGGRAYTGGPRYAPTNPAQVRLLRYEPRRPHAQLGEVWLRPEPGMSSRYVEHSLRERAAALGADALVIVEDGYFRRHAVRHYWQGRISYRERVIVGIAIRYR